MAVKALVVDDSAMVRQVLRDLLSMDQDIAVLGVAPDHARAPETLVICSSSTEADEPMSVDALRVCSRSSQRSARAWRSCGPCRCKLGAVERIVPLEGLAAAVLEA